MITLPMYYLEEKVRVKDKNWFLGLNSYPTITSRFGLVNKMKAHIKSLIVDQLNDIDKQDGIFMATYDVYYKRTDCDASNVMAVVEKFTLDAMQELDIIKGDDVKFHKKTEWTVRGQDKDNPRIEMRLYTLFENEDV